MIAAVVVAVVIFTLGVAFTPRQQEIPRDRNKWHTRPPK